MQMSNGGSVKMSSSRSEKAEFWNLALGEFRSSGLTIREFCRREGLSEPAFYAWRKKLQKQPVVGNHVDQAIGGSKSVDGVGAGVRLVPVKLVDKAEQHRPSEQVEVVTPGGVTIRFGDSLGQERLQAVLSSVLRCESESSRC